MSFVPPKLGTVVVQKASNKVFAEASSYGPTFLYGGCVSIATRGAISCWKKHEDDVVAFTGCMMVSIAFSTLAGVALWRSWQIYKGRDPDSFKLPVSSK